jgi:cysteine desulfurase
MGKLVFPECPSELIYMDNNATTSVAQEVIDEMLPYLQTHYGNPSSMHKLATKAGNAVDNARGQVMDLLGIKSPLELVFTGSGSESDNLAIVGTLRADPKKKHIVTTKVEHPAVQGLCRELEKHHDIDVTWLSVDGQGRLDLAELRDSLRDDTAIVSIMAANNETGVIFPYEEIGKIVKERGIVYHVDAVQVAGKLPLNMNSSTIDLLSISAHKLHGCKGVGALYVKRGSRLRPLIVGGHQERGRRAGTENVPGLVAFGKACELAGKYIEQENSFVRNLRDRLENKIIESVPDSRVNGTINNRLPNTTNISFDYIEGEGILLMMNMAKIAASSGSACTSGSLEPSHVLKAMGIPFISAHGSVRFSLSRFNTEAEVDYVAAVMPQIIEKLRSITPFNQEQKTF